MVVLAIFVSKYYGLKLKVFILIVYLLSDTNYVHNNAAMVVGDILHSLDRQTDRQKKYYINPPKEKFGCPAAAHTYKDIKTHKTC